MFFLYQLYLSILIIAFLHITTMALAALFFKVKIQEISYGVGLKLIKHQNITIGLFPFGGSVRFKEAEPDDDLEQDGSDLINNKSRVIQIIISLSGCLLLILLAFLLSSIGALSSLVSGFSQIIFGALEPLSTAQSYLGTLKHIAENKGFIHLLAVLSAKFAALNLLPLPFFNGGHVLLLLLRLDPGKTPAWQITLFKWSLLPGLALVLSWLLALIYFFIHN